MKAPEAVAAGATQGGTRRERSYRPQVAKVNVS